MFDRSLIQILDAEIFDLMHQNGDYTHFYFCYRWFLLDFKRGTSLLIAYQLCSLNVMFCWIAELVYDDVFTVWETIWAARVAASSHFVLFVALALVQYYRDIILANSMDFTDIIKFFNGRFWFPSVLNFDASRLLWRCYRKRNGGTARREDGAPVGSRSRPPTADADREQVKQI